jgi:hypothetical protein
VLLKLLEEEPEPGTEPEKKAELGKGSGEVSEPGTEPEEKAELGKGSEVGI